MPREVGNGPQSVEARLERLGWREREFRGGLDTLPRPGETTFGDEDFANCFVAGGTVAPSSAIATTAETAAPVAGTASEELDGEEVCVDGRDAETTAAGEGVVDDSRTSEGSAPPPHDPPAPRRAIVYEPLDWRRPGVPPAPRPRVSARKLLRRPEPAVRRRRRLLPVAVLLATVAGAVAVAGIAGAFSGGAGPSRSTADAGQTQLTTQASSRAVPPPSDQLLHRTPSHAVGRVAARGAGHAARPHRRQRRRQPQRAKGATARRATAASSSARASNPSSTGSSSGSYSGSGSSSYSGSSSAPSTSSQRVTSEPTPATSTQRIQPAQPTFGQNGSLGPGRGAPGTQ
jgi:hypothetical protein